MTCSSLPQLSSEPAIYKHYLLHSAGCDISSLATMTSALRYLISSLKKNSKKSFPNEEDETKYKCSCCSGTSSARIRDSSNRCVDAWAVDTFRVPALQGIVDPNTALKSGGSVHYRAKQPLFRQEASAQLDKAFR
ncbi:hypothetical protein QP775_13235 [Paenibacillus sp. UMB4589-SE434]|nr:hypothetical protein [Paenibacillus sp. UMB4589-SE434]